MKKLSFSHVGPWGFVLLFFALTAIAQARSNSELLSALDINGDGYLDENEVKLGLQHRLKPASVDLGRLKAGKKISSADLDGLDETVPLRYWEFQRDYSPQTRYKIGQRYNGKEITPDRFGITSVPSAPPEMDTTSRYVLVSKKPEDIIKVRRSADQLLLSADTSESALFSYTHDFKAKSDQWAAHGAVGLEFDFKQNPDYGRPKDAAHWAGPVDPATGRLVSGGFQTLYVRPSVAFDKVDTGGGDTDEVDSLACRLGVGAFYTVPRRPGDEHEPLIGSIKAEVSAKYDTDFSGERKVVGGEINVVPISDLLPLESYRGLGPLQYAFSVILHFEGNFVADDGGDEDLKKTDSYFRAGPFVSLTIRPQSLKGLVLGASYKYYPSLTSSSYALELFSAYLEWKIFNSEHLSVKLNYDQGRTQDRPQRDQVFTTGLGILF